MASEGGHDDVFTDPQELARSHIGLVRALAWRVRQRLPAGVDLDDLIGYGYVGLMEASSTFDGGRGVAFSTYAYRRIHGSIIDSISKFSWFDIGKYYGNDWRDPAEGPPQRTGSAERRRARVLRGLGEGTAAGSMPSRAQDPVAGAIENETRMQLYSGLARLEGVKATVVRMIMLREMSFSEVAESMGVSKSWVAKLYTQAIDDLASMMNPATARHRAAVDH